MKSKKNQVPNNNEQEKNIKNKNLENNKPNDKKNPKNMVNSKEEEEKIELLNYFEKIPHDYTLYLLDLLYKTKGINFKLFEKNIKTIKQKINSIIKNKDDKDNEDLYIILSTIYGAFLADSMGSFCEFTEFNKKNHEMIFKVTNDTIFQPGQVTDDSEMAMSLAYSIMDNPNYKSLNQNLMFFYYVIWYYSDPLDSGVTTQTALSTIDQKELENKLDITSNNIFSSYIKKYINKSNKDSLANGLLMRLSPLLTWFYMMNKNYIQETLEADPEDKKSKEKYYNLYQKIFVEVEKDAQLTHPNRENAVAGSILIFIGLCAMSRKYSGKQILNFVQTLFEEKHFNSKEEAKLRNHYIDMMQNFRDQNFKEDFYFGNLSNQMGYYLHAFKLTIYYLYIFDDLKGNNIYNQIIYKICDYGGDTDTNAAIVGMIIGPLIGLENFDKKKLEIFLNFYSKTRLIYTNVLMYFYAKYLVDISKNSSSQTKHSKFKFNVFEILYDMLNKEL
jgi:ADP-ribosylglycohydrolase